MRRAIVFGSVAIAVAGAAFALVHAQTGRPADEGGRARVAKDFGMTVEQFDRFVREELGEPVVVDQDLIVGVRRDAAGRVRTVKVHTPKRGVEFGRDADDQNPGLRYAGGEIAADAAFASAADLDGDARIDQVMIRKAAGEPPAVLLRIGNRFEPATAAGGRRFKLESDGRTVAFDRAAHEWVARE